MGKKWILQGPTLTNILEKYVFWDEKNMSTRVTFYQHIVSLNTKNNHS